MMTRMLSKFRYSEQTHFVTRIGPLLVAGIALIFSGTSVPGSIFCNLGWLTLSKGLMVSSLPKPSSLQTAQNWFVQAEKQTISLPKCALYGKQLSNLLDVETTMAQATVSDYQWDHADPRIRAQLFGVVQFAVHFTDQAQTLGLTNEEEDWRSIAGNANEILFRYESKFATQKMTYQDMLRRVVLCQKSNRPDLTNQWEEQIRLHFSGDEYKWLHELQNPYAQFALSEAYASLGFFDDAIRVAEESLKVSYWDWGHVVLSGFYRQLGRWLEAESQLQAAIASPGLDQSVAQYRIMLGDLYREQGETRLAKIEYCHVLQDIPLMDAAGNQNMWRANAVSRLEELTGMNSINVSVLCSIHK